MTPQAKGILLVEDDENDVFFMKLAMSKAMLDPPIHVSDNGQDAIDYLAGSGPYADRTVYPLPRCIFLDLKLPFVHGFEVLEWIGKEASLAGIRVFILTSSPEDRDRQRATQLGAKAYLLKPPTAQMLLEVLESECADASSTQGKPASNFCQRA
jgi:CheY-like chemotaxis protein